MADTFDKWTLNEMAAGLKIAVSWVNDLQRKTGIPKPIGRKGERSYFEALDVEKIKLAYILRTLGLSFGEIKNLNDTNFFIRGIKEASKKLNERHYEISGIKKRLEDIKTTLESLSKRKNT